MAVQNKVGLVTGGAAGIGLALTKHLLSKGWRVVIADKDVNTGKKVAKELGPDVFFLECDVSDWDSSAVMFKNAFEWAGHIDFLAANAGTAEHESLYALPEDPEPQKPNLATIEVDLLSTFYGLKLYRHYVRKSGAGGGKVVATASMAGLYPMFVAPIYGAAKHGLVGLCRAAGPRLYSSENITLNCVCPGPVDTGISPGMQKLVPEEHMTPMDVVVSAFDKFLSEDITGQVAECSGTEVFIRQPVEYSNDTARFLNQDMLKPKKFDNYYEHGSYENTD
ncbi:related to 15-hydroxyprostaglandin dehydrogenase (NAD(+)) [Phialocephala subalpina]|uniref:Related to 15-hydroxyprostaglandin dehydrogenase (NAD(+)) n=1 Tax=Phialocephala subalpina TaxID=576137 RepID=A0A1L7XUU6_9HELO|nr:related to 15-hydroxyprostaglandin dehydrogenase (NAD(+)) [Phialocephala subalpina]